MNVIWKKGYGDCSIKALSESLGITRSSLYNAFESREQIFQEALDAYSLQSPDIAFEDADENTPILPLINKVFREVCKVRAADPEARGCLVINCLAEGGDTNQEVALMLENIMKRNLEQFEKLLRLAAKRGEIPQERNDRETALALQNLLIGVNMISKVVREESDLRAIVRRTLIGLGLYVED